MNNFRKIFLVVLGLTFVLAVNPTFAEKDLTIEIDKYPKADVYVPSEKKEPVAHVTYIFDDVRVQRGETRKLIKLKKGMDLFAKDIVMTFSNNARAEIKFNNGHISRLGGQSKLIIEFSEITSKKTETTLLNLLKGKILMEVEKLKNRGKNQSRFELKTPLAVTAVKGTKFLVTTQRNINEIKVIEGLVIVSSTAGKVEEIPGGMKTKIVGQMAPTKPKKLTQKDLEEIELLRRETNAQGKLSPYSDNLPNRRSLNFRFFRFKGFKKK